MKNGRIVPIILAIFIIYFDSLCKAEEPATILSARNLGMGGASVTIAIDEDIFFSNPAILSFIEHPVFEPLDIKMGFNSDSIRFPIRLDEYKVANFNKLSEAQVSSLNELKPLYKLNGPLNIIYTRKHIGLGLFQAFDLVVIPEYSSLDEKSSLRINAQQTIFGLLALAYEFIIPPRTSYISVGMNFKYVGRAKIKGQDADDLIDNGAIVDIGRGFGLDIGMLYKIKNTYSFGLMVRDAFSSDFVWDRVERGSTNTNIMPEKTKFNTHAVLGASFTPSWEIPGILRNITFTFDLDSLSHPKIGAETCLYRFLWLRSGINEHGIALGFGIKANIMVFDYAFNSKIEDTYTSYNNISGHFISINVRL